jgi:hypothetical protein
MSVNRSGDLPLGHSTHFFPRSQSARWPLGAWAESINGLYKAELNPSQSALEDQGVVELGDPGMGILV